MEGGGEAGVDVDAGVEAGGGSRVRAVVWII